MHKILFLRRDPSLYPWISKLERRCNFPSLGAKTLYKKYQGFEGQLVDYLYVDNEKSDFLDVNKTCLDLKRDLDCEVIHLISNADEMPMYFRDKSVKLGYDFGVCDEEETVYSSVFNEILFGVVKELIDFKVHLNDRFLFPSMEIAKQYSQLHSKLSSQGKDVEDYMEMTIFEIWKQ